MAANTAYILLNIETKNENNLITNLKKIAEVEDAELIYGKYDIIVRAKVNNFSTFNAEIVRKIRNVEGVVNTITLISA